MIPALLQSGLIGYDIIQVLIAFIAVILALKWEKIDFSPGLCFLLLYTIVEMIDLFFFFTILQNEYIDVAQFGFILLAIIFFIIGMHPSGRSMMLTFRKQNDIPPASPRNESMLSLLRKS